MLYSVSPRLEDRASQCYAAIRAEATRETLAETVGGLFGEVAGWLRAHALKPSGAPFIRYLHVDEEGEEPTLLEVGFPLSQPIAGDGRIIPGTLPEGLYLTVWHTGPYEGLREETASLLNWASEHGVEWARQEDGKRWAGRLEIYPTDPCVEPDPQKWQTQLAFMIRQER